MGKIMLIDTEEDPLRLAFPALWEAEAYGEGQPMFKARLIVMPGGRNAKLIDAEYAKLAAADKNWGAKFDAICKTIATDKKKNNWLKCDYTNDEGDVYDGFEGMYSLAANNEVQPLIIDLDKSDLTRRDGRPYSGCHVNAQVEPWLQSNKHGKALRCRLKGVQFVRDGDAFQSGAPASKDDFADLSNQGADNGGKADFPDGDDADDLV